MTGPELENLQAELRYAEQQARDDTSVVGRALAEKRALRLADRLLAALIGIKTYNRQHGEG